MISLVGGGGWQCDYCLSICTAAFSQPPSGDILFSGGVEVSFRNKAIGAEPVVLTEFQRNEVAGTLTIIHECAGEEGKHAILAAWEAASTDLIIFDQDAIRLLHAHNLVDKQGKMQPHIAVAINQSLRRQGNDGFTIARVT